MYKSQSTTTNKMVRSDKTNPYHYITYKNSRLKLILCKLIQFKKC